MACSCGAACRVVGAGRSFQSRAKRAFAHSFCSREAVTRKSTAYTVAVVRSPRGATRCAGDRAMDTTFGSGIRHPDRVEFEQDYPQDGGGRSNCNWHNIPRRAVSAIILSRLPDPCGALFLLWVGSSHRVHRSEEHTS